MGNGKSSMEIVKDCRSDPFNTIFITPVGNTGGCSGTVPSDVEDKEPKEMACVLGLLRIL